MNCFFFISFSSQGVLLCFPLRQIPLSPPFTFLSVSKKWGGAAAYVDVYRVSCRCIPVESACARWLWWESWICCEHKSRPSSGILVAATLAGWGAEARARHETGLPFCSVAITTPLGPESGPKLLEKKPLVQDRADSASFIWSFAPEQCWSESGWCGSQWGLVLGLWWSGCSSRSILPLMLPSSNSCPPPCSDLTSGMSLGFQRWDFPSLVAALAVMWSCNMRRAVLEHLFGSGWDIPCGGPGKSVSHLHGFKLPSLPCFRRKKVFVRISWAESRLPSALLLVPPAPQAAERACVPFVRTQDWGTHMRLELPTPQGRSPPVRSLPLGWSLPRGPGSDLIISLPFLPDSLWVFLTALTVQDSFCLSPVGFQWELFNMQVYF